jgi:hypothetical protein
LITDKDENIRLYQYWNIDNNEIQREILAYHIIIIDAGNVVVNSDEFYSLTGRTLNDLRRDIIFLRRTLSYLLDYDTRLKRYWGLHNNDRQRQELLARYIRTIDAGDEVDAQELESRTSRTLDQLRLSLTWLREHLSHLLVETVEEKLMYEGAGKKINSSGDHDSGDGF